MFTPNQVVSFQFSKFFKSVLSSGLLLGCFWALFVGLNWLGVNFPEISPSRLFDFGFFSLSTFSFITFLTMIPIQTAEAKLSPGFYARMIHNQWTHFGLYVIVLCSIVSIVVTLVPTDTIFHRHLCELFLANLSSIIFAIIFHRYWVLRNLYQPLIVYEQFEKLSKQEGVQELWFEVYEIAYKAIREGRIANSKDFIGILSHIFYNYEKVQRVQFDDDLRSLYKTAEGVRPVARFMEEKFPFLVVEKRESEKISIDQLTPALLRVR